METLWIDYSHIHVCYETTLELMMVLDDLLVLNPAYQLQSLYSGPKENSIVDVPARLSSSD